MPACWTHAGRLSSVEVSTTMTNSTTLAEKNEESVPDHQRADTASNAFKIGIDAQGREHYFSRIRHRITVVDDGDHEHTEPLDNRPLSEWMHFVEAEFDGWTEHNTFSGSVTEHFCDQLASAVNGGDRR